MNKLKKFALGALVGLGLLASGMPQQAIGAAINTWEVRSQDGRGRLLLRADNLGNIIPAGNNTQALGNAAHQFVLAAGTVNGTTGTFATLMNATTANATTANLATLHSSTLINATALTYPRATHTVQAITANATLTVANASNIQIGTLAGNITLTIPSAVTAGAGAHLIIQDVGGTLDATHTLSINATSGNLNGAAMLNITTAYAGKDLESDGTNWFYR